LEHTAPVYLQLGAVVLALGIGARLASAIGLSPVPLYLFCGLVVGALDVPALSGDFVQFAGQLGVILLLFIIGLEYTAEELSSHLQRFRRAALADALLNFPPGFAFGMLLGWGPVAAIVLGGVTWVSSSGIVAKTLSDLRRQACPETPAVLSVLVMEDLAMAGYLPLVASLIVGGGVLAGIGSVVLAALAATAALVGAMRFGGALERAMARHSEEALMLSVLGFVLLIAGVAETLQVSAAVGAFLVGVALSGEVADRTTVVLSPLRDFNAALFFLFFGLQIDVHRLATVAVPALALALLTGFTKAVTGWLAAARAGVDDQGRARAATALLARGEFSIVLAGLAANAGVEPQLAPLAAGYVLITAVAGPILMHYPGVTLTAARIRRKERLNRDGGDLPLSPDATRRDPLPATRRRS
jgi:CPA2 family monovalent cation:H+ antiporter-2